MAKRRLNGESLIKIALIIMFMFYAWSFGAGADASGDGPYTLVQVGRGDTVWSIAAKHTGEKDDIRNLVVAIKKINNLGNDVAIHPGQTLKVPIKAK